MWWWWCKTCRVTLPPEHRCTPPFSPFYSSSPSVEMCSVGFQSLSFNYLPGVNVCTYIRGFRVKAFQSSGQLLPLRDRCCGQRCWSSDLTLLLEHLIRFKVGHSDQSLHFFCFSSRTIMKQPHSINWAEKQQTYICICQLVLPSLYRPSSENTRVVDPSEHLKREKTQ